MKLTKKNFNLVIDYIDEQVNDDNWEFDEKTDLLYAFKKTIEIIKEEKKWLENKRTDY